MRFASSFALLLLPAFVHAEAPRAFRFIPREANLVVHIEKPRALAEAVTGLDLVKQMDALPFVREQMQSPQFQRFKQLLAYYERDLGAQWPELLDRLAGKGITLAAKADGGDNAPVLLLIDGTDEALTEKLVHLAVSVFEQELGREESKEKVEKGEYRGVTGYKIGELRFARIGTTLLLSNKKEVLKLALDLHHGEGKSLADAAGPAEARKILPGDCLAWLWFDVSVARNAPGLKEAIALPSNDPIQTFLIGGWLNVIARARYLAVGLTRDADAFRVTLRMPGGGYEGMPEALALHVPPKGETHGQPLLEPRGVIYSQSFYFDFKALWEKRAKIFNDKIARDFEEGERKARPFTPGTTLSQLAMQSGASHRVVVAHQESTGYRIKPKQYLPAFAFVTRMRDESFARTMEAILRGVALTQAGAFKPKLVDEMRGAVKIVGYRLPEDRPVADDPTDQRFNFSPCFARVNNQFVICSTFELCRELVDLLQREFESSRHAQSTAPLQGRFYASGGVDLLRGLEEQVLGQIVLDQAVPPAEGRKQLMELMNWVKRLGTLEIRTNYLDTEFRFDAEWKFKK